MARVAQPATTRFQAKLQTLDSACIVWTGCLNKDGYGSFRVGEKTVLAHRFANEQAFGSIPAGIEIDHRCRNRACCNPEHHLRVTGDQNKRLIGIRNKAQGKARAA
jgi:hypothetical protein